MDNDALPRVLSSHLQNWRFVGKARKIVIPTPPIANPNLMETTPNNHRNEDKQPTAWAPGACSEREITVAK